MALFLSPAWFDQVADQADPRTSAGDVVLQQVVTATPDGEVRYQVMIINGRASIHRGSEAEANMTFTSDYETATAVASGALSAETALSEGRIRIAGDLTRLDSYAETLAGLDPLGSARAATSFEHRDDDA
ncbi:MAG: SCP2 sterol-binding domain-containing protein [Actinomycetota bacterium]|nr:SCP2 sterol-binding domain-containing protein [Actinomycetota bacterium]